MKKLSRLIATLLVTVIPAGAAITTVVETGLAADVAAAITDNFAEDANSYVDRTSANAAPNGHQHNGPAFNSSTGLLSTTGDLIVGLPSYLIGKDYIRFANNARDNAGYQAVVTTDTPSTFYVLIDNRTNGPNTAAAKTNTTDPTLGGSLQWVIDGGWIRMNTGLSPNGQGDFTAVDETGDGVGPGVRLNNFMSVYKFPTIATTVTVKNTIYAGNNIAVVAVPTAPPAVPIVSYVASPITILPGGSASLSWLISRTATSAGINQGIGSILPLTDANGAGSVVVNPPVNTTYTLTVNTPTGNNTLPATVTVQPLATFTATRQRIDPGESVVLNWRVRPDAMVSIDGIGSVKAQTDPVTGIGSRTVQPTVTTDYVLRAEAEGLTNSAGVSVVLRPAGQSFALIDIGATGGRVEPGAVNSRTIGAAADPVNGMALPATTLLADTGAEFTLAVDNVDPDGNEVGSIDWRDRGDSPVLPLNRLLEDMVKNNAGLIRVSLGQLPAGTYDVTSYHVDVANSQTDQIRILVTDANGVATDTTVTANASWPGHPANTGAPTITGITPGRAVSHQANFRIKSNGTDDVLIYFDSRTTPVDIELPLNGLQLSQLPPRPLDPTWALIDIGASSGQPEPGAANQIVVGNAAGVNATNLGPVALVSRTGVNFQLTFDNADPLGNLVGGLDWRDRGNSADVPLGWLAEDFVKNNQGLIRVAITGLPAGTWQIRSYHLDPTLSQSAAIKVFVSDATRTAADTLLVADSSFPTGDPGAPQLNGLNAGLIGARSVAVEVVSNGTGDVVLYFDSTLAGGDLELPLSGLRITPSGAPQVIAVTAVVRTVNGGTASVAVTFTSKPGKTYTVYGTNNPLNRGTPLTTTLAATGTTTTYTEMAIPLTTPRRFYQIREN